MYYILAPNRRNGVDCVDHYGRSLVDWCGSCIIYSRLRLKFSSFKNVAQTSILQRSLLDFTGPLSYEIYEDEEDFIKVIMERKTFFFSARFFYLSHNHTHTDANP